MADGLSTPGLAQSSHHHHHHHNRNARVLACVLCQHRKIKCDRNTPCSNCLKANVTCTPSTPAPARKRRRPNQDLQERLARCEDLLKQYAGGSGPDQVDQSPVPATPSESQTDSPCFPYTSGEAYMKWKPAGKMIKEDGGVRFMDSYLWASVYDELQAMRDIVETDDPEDSSVLGADELTPDNHSDLYFSVDMSTSTNLEELQPDPVHVFRLWQLFLDRVNPLSKVVHVPSMQAYVMEAATNMSNIALNYQALLFAIFNMASVSLTNAESMQMLGMPRETAVRRFTAGTKIALMRFNFLKNYHMTTVQALVLHLFSIQGRTDRHAAWILSGTVVRIAQKMGYHRDGETLNLLPFETEMRRRIWWQIIMHDAKNAMISGLSHALLPLNWDTKEPLNVNDADLFPGSTDTIQAREGPTEMAFCLLVYQIAKFMISTSSSPHGAPGFEAAVLGQELSAAEGGVTNQESIDKYRGIVSELESAMVNVEQKYVDATAGPVHVAALTIRPMLVNKLREMLVPMREQPEWGTEIFGPKDNLFKVVIMNNEHNTDAYKGMEHNGFLWFVKLHFQLDVFAVMTGQLYQRPTGNLADRAWKNIDLIYAYHHELSDMTQKPYAVQAQFTLRAWKAREQAYAQAGRVIETPPFIRRLRETAPSEISRSSTQSSATPPATMQGGQQQQITELDQFLGGYLDVSSLNWDMWGDVGGSNTAPPPANTQAAYTGFALQDLNGMGGMGGGVL